MGASLAVIVANNWMQSFKGLIKDENDGIKQVTKNHLKNPNCSKNFV